jgi:small subunit ribosomal protein S6
MTQYELMMIIKPTLDDVAVKAVTAKVKGWLESKGGSVTEVKEWGKRTFATPIAKFTDGWYVLIYYTGEGQAINGYVDEQFVITEEVLRHMVVVHDPNAVTKPAKRAQQPAAFAAYVQH